MKIVKMDTNSFWKGEAGVVGLVEDQAHTFKTKLYLKNGQVKDYSVEIQRIDITGNKKNKSLVIRITDPELLSLTGGIIQGTSGSPLIQNGKLIGAITHVFVQDPTRGYGILIEDMLGH